MKLQEKQEVQWQRWQEPVLIPSPRQRTRSQPWGLWHQVRRPFCCTYERTIALENCGGEQNKVITQSASENH